VRRRRFLLAASALALSPGARAEYAEVRTGTRVTFPADHGAHPAYRTEWWYITGWVQDAQQRPYGIQVTFFRNRPLLQEDNPSAFAPKQLLFAHAAIADPSVGHLLHDQRVAREGLGLAYARDGTTDVRIDDWRLALHSERYLARVSSRELDMDLTFTPTQPVLLQGEAGYSRKGPRPEQASHYYSRPHLATRGRIELRGSARDVSGVAWLDHEWSSEYLAADAIGWDWAGINLDDGGALTVFRIRARGGGEFWAGGSLRVPGGATRAFGPRDLRFEHLRTWRSSRTAVEYPVAMRVQAAGRTLDLEPLMDDQELDSRASTGTIYWEGAVRAVESGRAVGRGYLELTGYWQPLEM
jgi:predicted secreted hydrolase